jgi:hypothetical protein
VARSASGPRMCRQHHTMRIVERGWQHWLRHDGDNQGRTAAHPDRRAIYPGLDWCRERIGNGVGLRGAGPMSQYRLMT